MHVVYRRSYGQTYRQTNRRTDRPTEGQRDGRGNCREHVKAETQFMFCFLTKRGNHNNDRQTDICIIEKEISVNAICAAEQGL